MGSTNRGFGSPLAEWCQTHSFLEFLELTKEKNMNEELNTDQLLAVDGEEVTLAPAADSAGIQVDATKEDFVWEAGEKLVYTQEGVEDDAELIAAPF